MKILLFCYTEAIVWIIFSFCSFETAFALVLAATTASDSACVPFSLPHSKPFKLVVWVYSILCISACENFVEIALPRTFSRANSELSSQDGLRNLWRRRAECWNFITFELIFVREKCETLMIRRMDIHFNVTKIKVVSKNSKIIFSNRLSLTCVGI